MNNQNGQNGQQGQGYPAQPGQPQQGQQPVGHPAQPQQPGFQSAGQGQQWQPQPGQPNQYGQQPGQQWQQPQYGQQPNGQWQPQQGQPIPAQKKTSVMAIVGLILAIFALITCWIPFLNNLTIIPVVLGLVLGIVAIFCTGKNKKKKGRGIAIAAVIISVISFAGIMATQSAYVDALNGPNASSVEKADSGSSSASSSDSSNKAESSSDSDASNLKIGDTVTLEDGLKVKVSQVKSKSVYGNKYKAVKVTYTNGSDDTIQFGPSDWEYEDKNGSLEYAEYSLSDDELSSGSLKPGGKKEGWVYFKTNAKKACFMGTMFDDEPKATWTL